MPRTENQKVVTAYLSLELYDKLENFKLSEGLKSDSKAIITMLERWFFEPPIITVEDKSISTRLQDLEDKYLFLSQCIESFKSTVDSTVNGTVNSTVESTVDGTVESTVNSTVESTVNSTVESTVNSTVESTVDGTVDSTVDGTVDGTVDSTVDGTVDSTIDLSKGLSHRSLAKRLQCSHPFIAKLLKSGEITSYSQSIDPDGLAWEHREGKYYPLQAFSESPNEAEGKEDRFVVCEFDKEVKQYRYWAGASKGFTSNLHHASNYKSEKTAEQAVKTVKQSSECQYSPDEIDRFEVGYKSVEFLSKNRPWQLSKVV